MDFPRGITNSRNETLHSLEIYNDFSTAPGDLGRGAFHIPFLIHAALIPLRLLTFVHRDQLFSQKHTVENTDMNHEKIRRRQRFANLEKAFALLQRTIAIEHPSEAERGGLIQFFEIAFELSWKTLKDFLESEGYTIRSPREAIKQGFQIVLIEDGHVWMRALDDRNLTTQAYEEAVAVKVESLIREDYSPAIQSTVYQTETGNITMP